MTLLISQERKVRNIKVSITKAIQERFRPLVTTSFTTVVGLIPLALNDPFWEGLAFSIVFGLIASTTLVIFVFPSYYVMVERTRELRNKLFEKISNLVTN
ncbi:MAG: hypothetical protein KatS3mg085_637 [Candidatus Dojkabacteria bacterium]|nr:MAG: hypothetical protein KatS3mg085_637 [Candidatus Dojkabacteria bacterium]